MIAVLLVLLAIPVLVCAGYLFWLAMMARPLPVPAYAETRLKFDLAVPAHDDAATIADTIKSLRAIDYPERLVRLIVVADHCKDDTAAIAEGAGAIVLKLDDPKKTGKAHALAEAFDLAARDGIADAVVVVDADSEVSPNLLQAFAARLEAGAKCVQAEYRVRNPLASKRARAMQVGVPLVHTLRSLTRERLGLSAALRGNGVALSRSVLADAPRDASPGGFDAELGVRLAMAGHRVFYAHEAFVNADVPATEDAALARQRAWEGGRVAVAKAHLAELAKLGWKKKDRVLLDVAMDVVMPPITILVAVTAIGTLASLGWASGHDAFPAYVWGLAMYFLLFSVVRGWALSGVGVAALASFAYAPVLVAQRIALGLRRPAARKAAG